MTKKIYDAVIVAGGHAPWLKEAAGTDIRCLARINGKRMLDYQVQALRASGRINRILIAAPEEAFITESLPEGVESCVADRDLSSTTVKAANALGVLDKVLFICDDIPLISGESINDFLNQCEQAPDYHVYYPVIPKADCEAKYPHAKRTYVVAKGDGLLTGGNLMLIDTHIVPQGEAKSREIFERRKRPFELASWLGFGFILKFLLHRLSLADVEKRASELMGMKGKAIISHYPELGMDIDKPADLELAQKYLR